MEISINKIAHKDFCLNCHARNFDYEEPNMRHSDDVYEIRIRNLSITLCQNCLKKLAEKIKEQV